MRPAGAETRKEIFGGRVALRPTGSRTVARNQSRPSGAASGFALPYLPPHLRQPTGDEGREPVQDRHADGKLTGDMPEALCCIATQCPLGFRGVLLSPANSCRECHVIFNHFRPKANSPGGTCVTGRVKVEHIRLSGGLRRQRHPPRLLISDHLLSDVP